VVSLTGRYALRILGYLAEKPETWVQGSQIAADTGIPANYLSKIMNQLRKKGYVESQRGWGGGFLLREKVLETRIHDVLTYLEGPRDDTTCIFGLRDCDEQDPCPLHDRWEAIRGGYKDMLQQVTIGDLRSAQEI
jgi:Rrf2 family iron-sulfur cluster assembly transcriptional regulator